MAVAGSPVATSTVASARVNVEIGFIAARTRSTSPVDIPPSTPPARPVRRRTPSAPGSISSWASEPRRRASVEAVAELDPLDRLDGQQRGGQPGVEAAVAVHVAAQPGRQAVGEHLDDATERVRVPVGRVDLGDHRGAGGGVGAADGVGVDARQVARLGQRRLRRP